MGPRACPRRTTSPTTWSARSSASLAPPRRSSTSSRRDRSITSRATGTCAPRCPLYFGSDLILPAMPQRPSRSLKHEYEIFVEREIEDYKESVPRSVLLSIGDDAVHALAGQQQFALTELLLCDEVDRIIFKRLRLPSYATWRKRRVKLMEELRRPEHWGLSPDDAVVRAVQSVAAEARVLFAGGPDENRALFYLAAHGCDVTALADPADVQRVLDAAEKAGLGERVHASAAGLDSWTPEAPLTAVIYTPAAF